MVLYYFYSFFNYFCDFFSILRFVLASLDFFSSFSLVVVVATFRIRLRVARTRFFKKVPDQSSNKLLVPLFYGIKGRWQQQQRQSTLIHKTISDEASCRPERSTRATRTRPRPRTMKSSPVQRDSMSLLLLPYIHIIIAYVYTFKCRLVHICIDIVGRTHIIIESCFGRWLSTPEKLIRLLSNAFRCDVLCFIIFNFFLKRFLLDTTLLSGFY